MLTDSVFSDDVELTAWVIAARHMTAGQKDVTKMIADAIWQERARCIELLQSALGPGADHLAVFVADPDSDW